MKTRIPTGQVVGGVLVVCALMALGHPTPAKAQDGYGAIMAWGDNGSGQCNVPAPNVDFVAAAGGWGHSLGLKADGSIRAWGDNYYGQCNVLAPNVDLVAVAAGQSHSLGLKGYPYPLGDLNCDGQLDAFDIDPFVLALTAPSLYAVEYPDCDWMLADINGDGFVDAFDIDPFVELLVAP